MHHIGSGNLLRWRVVSADDWRTVGVLESTLAQIHSMETQLRSCRPSSQEIDMRVITLAADLGRQAIHVRDLIDDVRREARLVL